MLLHMSKERLASCRFPLRNLGLGPGMWRYLQRAGRFRPYDKNCNKAESAALMVMRNAYGEKASRLGLHTKLRSSGYHCLPGSKRSVFGSLTQQMKKTASA